MFWLACVLAPLLLGVDSQSAHAFGRQQGAVAQLADHGAAGGWSVAAALQHHHAHKASINKSGAAAAGDGGGGRKTTTILLIPSEINGDQRLQRLQAIARTWGAAAHALGIRIAALVSAPEAAVFAPHSATLAPAIDLLVVPAEHVGKGELLKGVFLGWLDHGPTLDQEMWALGELSSSSAAAAAAGGAGAAAAAAGGGGGGQGGAAPDWIVVANDAAFFLPSNLLCFLRGLPDPRSRSSAAAAAAAASPASPASPAAPPSPPALSESLSGSLSESLTYSGHVLLSDYAGGTPFASTGPGAVFSAGLARGMAAAWARGRAAGGAGGAAGAGDAAAQACVSTGNRWLAINPAVGLGHCAKALGAVASGDRDAQHGSRFHAYGPVRLASGATDGWFQQYHKAFAGEVPRAGAACCAADTVAFHYVEGDEPEFLWRVLVTERARFAAMSQAELDAVYPAKLGPYAHAPAARATALWELLREKIVVRDAAACGAPQVHV